MRHSVLVWWHHYNASIFWSFVRRLLLKAKNYRFICPYMLMWYAIYPLNPISFKRILINDREAGDLGRHRAHYDATVTFRIYSLYMHTCKHKAIPRNVSMVTVVSTEAVETGTRRKPKVTSPKWSPTQATAGTWIPEVSSPSAICPEWDSDDD